MWRERHENHWDDESPVVMQSVQKGISSAAESHSGGASAGPDYECGIWVPICRVPDKGEQERAETVASATLPGILYK